MSTSVYPPDEFSVEARDKIQSNANHVATTGWEFINLSSTSVSWWNPDGRGVYRLERKKSGWHGVLDGKDALPEYTDVLGKALEIAQDVMVGDSVERDP